MNPSKTLGARRASHGARWIAAATSIAGVALLVVACLDATQIEGVVSADTSICASSAAARPRARYAIRVHHLDSVDRADYRQNDGTFERCDSAQGSAFLGNFTLVPESSDGRDHLELIQLMVHTTNGDPDECTDIDPEGRPKSLPAECIVVRRRVRFVAHKGQRVPMYLDDRCLGKTCEEDSTCFRGVCRPANTTCDATSCIPEHERALAPGDLGGRDPSRIGNLPPGAIGVDDAGLITFTDGARVNEAGNIVEADGALVSPDGAIVEPDGALVPPDSSFDSSLPPPPDTGLPDALFDSGGSIPRTDCTPCAGLGMVCCSTSGAAPYFCKSSCGADMTCVTTSDGGLKTLCSETVP